jgi:hypothetical protein
MATNRQEIWEEPWLAAVTPARRNLWRGVEAQHQVATMRLVDDLREQELLEQVLEASKPALPPEATGLHYLLSTPFRYASPWPSRFRQADQPGAWYGADEPETVAGEIAHWRWRFFMDSDGLRDEQLVTEHTFFQALFAGPELDISVPPWLAHRPVWRDPDNYSGCQRLATRVRELAPPVAAIRFESARAEGGMCEVVFDARALSIPGPHLQQTWICKTTRQLVLLGRPGRSLEFRMN